MRDPAHTGSVTIRMAGERDRDALARLAGRDSRPAPTGACLVVEDVGALRAAAPLAGGPVIADPFHRTAELVALLELRVAQARGAGPPPPGRHGIRARPRPLPGRRFPFAVARLGR